VCVRLITRQRITPMDLDPGYAVAVRLLARHWCAHPLACDCEDSIEKWWMDSAANITRKQLHDALIWLERCGAVESLPAGDGRVRYRRRSEFAPDELRRIADAASVPRASGNRH